MTSEAELIVDRRRLRRKLSAWRVAAIVLAAAALLALAWSTGPFQHLESHIARVRVDGLITGDGATIDLLKDLRAAKAVKGVIVRIDSPGGTTAGSEAIYEELRKLAGEKPVVAVMDTVAASGGYITAIAADHIVARGNTITGSIGVIFTFPEISRLLDTLGIRMEEIKSGEFKAEPSPYKPASENVRAVSNALVQDGFNWFVDLVAERRKLARAEVVRLADGRVYTGRQAVAAKLVDELGGEERAISWLEAREGFPAGLKVNDLAPAGEGELAGLGFALGRGLAKAFGLESLGASNAIPKLDGLLVLWHPDL